MLNTKVTLPCQRSVMLRYSEASTLSTESARSFGVPQDDVVRYKLRLIAHGHSVFFRLAIAMAGHVFADDSNIRFGGRRFIDKFSVEHHDDPIG